MEIIDQLIIDLLKENKIDAETAVRLLKAIYRDSKEVHGKDDTGRLEYPQQQPHFAKPMDSAIIPPSPK